MYKDTALLSVVLFGQVLGAVRLADQLPPPEAYSAWSLDPRKREFRRSSFPAILLGTTSAKLTKAGHHVLTIMGPQGPVLYVEDGPNGPAEMPIETFRAESPQQALHLLDELARETGP